MEPSEFFNDWRRGYDQMPFADLVRWHEQVYQQWPTQRHFHLDTLDRFCRDVAPASVLEIGGWDGHAASIMLDRYPRISRWTNYELCLSAILSGLRHPRYQAVVANDFAWHLPLPAADAFIATHVIEHLRAADLTRLVDRLPVRWCHVEAPIPSDSDAVDWSGYVGSHILEVGWRQVECIFAGAGFACVHRHDDVRWFCRGA